MLPTGLGFVSGQPKIGKSYLVLQISGAVATGGVVFGKRVAQGRVFYLALEDTPRRIRDRLQQMGATVMALAMSRLAFTRCLIV